MVDQINFLKKIRYSVTRIISYPFPGFAAWIPYIGGKTSSQTLICCSGALLSIFYSLLDTEHKGGKMTDITLAIVVALSMRKNMMTFLFGISYERTIFWHMSVAFLTALLMLLHGYFDDSNFTGIVLGILVGVTICLYVVKPFWFELFYYLHILCFVAMVPFAILHGCIYFPAAMSLWVLDLLLRNFKTMTVVGQVSILPGAVIKMSFGRVFDFRPGQYCFIRVKELDCLEYHPFSISSAPEGENGVDFHIRRLGDWTEKLSDLVTIKSTAEDVKATNTLPMMQDTPYSIPLEIDIEGPYGQFEFDFYDPSYEVFLLVSGGIGITPMQSMFNSLVNQQRKGRKLRKVIFIWSVKDRAMVDTMHNDRHHRHLPLSFQPPMPPAPRVKCASSRSFSSSDKDENQHPSALAVVDLDGASYDGLESEESSVEMGDVSINSINSEPSGDTDWLRNSEAEVGIKSDYIFFASYHLTDIRPEDDFAKAGIHPETQKWVHFGRPNMTKIFQQTRELCEMENISKVGVGVCGPPELVHDVHDLCRESLFPIDVRSCLSGSQNNQNTDGGVMKEEKQYSRLVQFHLHREVFSF